MNFKDKTPRRNFLKKSISGTMAIGAGVTATAMLLQSYAANANEGAKREPGDQFQKAATEKEFRMGVIGPAELSKVVSQIAVTRATNKNAQEFAGFELAEAIAVTSVLTDLGTPVPAMDAKATATLNKIKSAAKGKDFDKAFIKAQLENHEFLRDLAQDYLNHAGNKTDPAESQGRHLATLSLAVFKEHVAITRRILGELGQK